MAYQPSVADGWYAIPFPFFKREQGLRYYQWDELPVHHGMAQLGQALLMVNGVRYYKLRETWNCSPVISPQLFFILAEHAPDGVSFASFEDERVVEAMLHDEPFTESPSATLEGPMAPTHVPSPKALPAATANGETIPTVIGGFRVFQHLRLWLVHLARGFQLVVLAPSWGQARSGWSPRWLWQRVAPFETEHVRGPLDPRTLLKAARRQARLAA